MSDNSMITDLMAAQQVANLRESYRAFHLEDSTYKPKTRFQMLLWRISILWSNTKYNVRGFLKGELAITIRGKIVDSSTCDD